MRNKTSQNIIWIIILVSFSLPMVLAPVIAFAGLARSTRIVDPKEHACTVRGGYPYREKADYVMGELDLRAGDVVVDVGAGDGWWAERMALFVGQSGTIHAAEVEQDKVDRMKERFTDIPQIKPYLCPYDGTALPDNSCDLAFLSKTYHHLGEGKHVEYLKHLHNVVKPTGRLCVIEQHRALATGGSRNHAWSPALLIEQAEEAGWILVRYELIKGTYHFMAIFAQKDLFPN
ncbi:MAG: class I SAM-dependent methyltransferase [Sedimentisphaerales bacterium]|nr:class I SAM-dependent methyltransferase [Sedimentisphaerales bacterium]